ncbi:tyrosine-type recombinase/integrase [Fusobacterium sp. SYSU M8D902]|uniref:tyrosine-type recombinase/integrase n=1 Tax=Fusobacterium sp. SYSU M8D902 TaxID=3159562 RepID=UPI0032E4D0B9
MKTKAKKKVGAKCKMSVVSDEDIIRIFDYLYINNLIVILGIVKFLLNTGKSIKEVLEIKFEDLKTDKTLNKSCLITARILKEYYKSKNYIKYDTGYLFKSYIKLGEEAISYKGVYKYFKKIQKDLEIKYPFNTNSLRKKWGKEVYRETGNILIVMKMLGQVNPMYTLEYIEEDNFQEVNLKENEKISIETLEKIYQKINY